jgi:predicted acetyltransferase
MSITIRTIKDAELPAYLEALTTTFLTRIDIARLSEELGRHWDLPRAWAAFDGDRVCGTFRTWASELTVPGGQRLAASAVTAVTVLPTHRRQGLLRRMAAAEHAAARRRGEVFGLLYASEYPIYGRFGYGVGCLQATWTLDTLGTAFHGDADGRVDLVPVSDTTREAMMGIFDGHRQRQPGDMRRRDISWQYDLGLESAWGERWKGFVALHRDATGAPDGYVRYHTEEKWEQRQPRGVLTVDELHALNDEAYAALWRFVADVDLITTVKAERRSPAERLPWLLTNARAANVAEVGDGLWVRIFDVRRALEARTYERPVGISLEIVDDELEGGRELLWLEAGRSGVECRPTDRPADLTLPVAALGAAYLGGTPLSDAVIATGAQVHRAGALVELDEALRTLDAPWCSTFF